MGMGSPPPGGGAGVMPPMPGSGIDPYAAMAGMISQIPPPGQPAGGGMMDMNSMGIPGAGGGGMGGGMDMGLPAGPPTDQITQALMSGSGPHAIPHDMYEHVLDPQMDQQQMSINQLLQILALAKGGQPPSSGVNPTSNGGSIAYGSTPQMFG